MSDCMLVPPTTMKIAVLHKARCTPSHLPTRLSTSLLRLRIHPVIFVQFLHSEQKLLSSWPFSASPVIPISSWFRQLCMPSPFTTSCRTSYIENLQTNNHMQLNPTKQGFALYQSTSSSGHQESHTKNERLPPQKPTQFFKMHSDVPPRSAAALVLNLF